VATRRACPELVAQHSVAGSAELWHQEAERSRVKDDVINRVLPQFFPKHWLDAPGIVFTDFPSRIRIGYVLRGDGSYSFILDDEFAGLGIALEELHAAALDNLAELPSASISIAKVPGGAEGWLHATDDNFAAVRILLPEVLREFTDALGEPFLFSVSHRDDCFCWSLAQSRERQHTHVRGALERFLQEDYNLTPDILSYSHEYFTLHLEQAVT
jgi:uncharacterized protein YtpQ (UPF0354 family)